VNPPWLFRHNSLNVADIVPSTEVEGPGKRFALWVQGCPKRCPGCCNPEMQIFEEKSWVPVRSLVNQIQKFEGEVEGITLVGGEPFCQAGGAGQLCVEVKKMGLGILVFTGFRYETLKKWAKSDPDILLFLQNIDLLIDGPFLEEKKSEKRCYIGSDNQEVHYLSERYKHFEGCWPTGDGAIEIRFDGENIVINGHPRPSIF